MEREIISRFVERFVKIGVPHMAQVDNLYYKNCLLKNIIGDTVEIETGFDNLEYVAIRDIRFIRPLNDKELVSMGINPEIGSNRRNRE